LRHPLGEKHINVDRVAHFQRRVQLDEKPCGVRPSQPCVDGNAVIFDGCPVAVRSGRTVKARGCRDDLDQAAIIGRHHASYGIGASYGSQLCVDRGHGIAYGLDVRGEGDRLRCICCFA
jgi:hypothetical protein